MPSKPVSKAKGYAPRVIAHVSRTLNYYCSSATPSKRKLFKKTETCATFVFIDDFVPNSFFFYNGNSDFDLETFVKPFVVHNFFHFVYYFV
jgi:hypothetical protein